MNKMIFIALGLVFSVNASAATEHYLREDGNHVQHLRINTVGKETHVSMDVDFAPNGAAEENFKPCSHKIEGEAHINAETALIVKKQADGEAHYCELTIKADGQSATVQQSTDCSYFLGSFCKFDSEGQSLKRAH